MTLSRSGALVRLVAAAIVALAVLPTVGRVRFRDRRTSEAAGWAMTAVLVTVMLTYFLAAVAKIRFGGWDWPTGATLTRAVLRRGTPLSDWTLDVPYLLPADAAAPIRFFVAVAYLLIGGALARLVATRLTA